MLLSLKNLIGILGACKLYQELFFPEENSEFVDFSLLENSTSRLVVHTSKVNKISFESAKLIDDWKDKQH